jgi:hypothetical protein
VIKAQRQKRVFNVDVPEVRRRCQAIACIEDQEVIDKILNDLQAKGALALQPELLPDARAQPNLDWFA